MIMGVCMYCSLDMNFTSFGDDEHWVYADDMRVGRGRDWKTAVISRIQGTTRVIAIKVRNTKSYGGLVGSLSDGSVITDQTWKCTRKLFANWTKVDFDDSKWGRPMAKRQNESPRKKFGPIYNVASNAKWIWKRPLYIKGGKPATVYFRKNMSDIV